MAITFGDSLVKYAKWAAFCQERERPPWCSRMIIWPAWLSGKSRPALTSVAKLAAFWDVPIAMILEAMGRAGAGIPAAKAKSTAVHAHWTPNEWCDLLIQYEYQCAYCGAYRSDLLKVGQDLTADHILCQELGGSDRIDNIAPSCKSCNSSKRISDLMLWAKKNKKQIHPLAMAAYQRQVSNV